MQEFEYEVVDRNGRLVKGQAEAGSVTELVRSLSADGHTVVEVNERRASVAPAGLRRRLRRQDVLVAFHELATLLESGVTLADAVLAQGRGSYQPALAAGFRSIAQVLMRGQSFREALHAGGLALPEYVYHLVEAGELSGLPRAVAAPGGGADALRPAGGGGDAKRAALPPRSSWCPASPRCCWCSSSWCRSSPTCSTTQPELPLVSEAVLRTGMWFNEHWWWLVGALVAAAALGATLWRQPAVRQHVRDILAALPFLGGWLSESDTATWASVMGAMLTSRVELMDALGLASRGVRTSRRRAALEQVTGDVRGGNRAPRPRSRSGARSPPPATICCGSESSPGSSRRCCAPSPRSTRRTAPGG